MSKKINLLIVDDDKTFLLGLKDVLVSYNKEYSVHIAFSGQEATDILNMNSIDIIIIDIKMQVMDGFALLIFVSNKFNNVSVIVTTEFGTEQIEKRIRHIGLCKYLEKPLNLNVLITLIKNCLDEKNAGFISGIDLTSILQLIEIEHQTCTLIITSDKKKGKMSFNNGILINAETDALKGDTAAYDIVLWGKTEIVISNKHINKKNITKTLNQILINAQSEIDKYVYISKNKKEKNMNVERLNEAIGGLKKDLGAGLLAVDFFSIADGQSLAGFNTQPKACALFTQLTTDLNQTLGGAGFPLIGKYYILDLTDKSMVIVIPLGDYMCGMLLDKDNTKLGLVLNIGIPKAIDVFEEAIVS